MRGICSCNLWLKRLLLLDLHFNLKCHSFKKNTFSKELNILSVSTSGTCTCLHTSIFPANVPLGVIWLRPTGSLLSICVSLTHFSPRPHPTVLFLRHMCGGGKGINECLPCGTCWHGLWLWQWRPALWPFRSPRHMSLIQGSYVCLHAHMFLIISIALL